MSDTIDIDRLRNVAAGNYYGVINTVNPESAVRSTMRVAYDALINRSPQAKLDVDLARDTDNADYGFLYNAVRRGSRARTF